MLIQCTKKLLDELKIKPGKIPEEDQLFSWHGNLITVNRRKAVVLMNNKNNYMVVLYGLKAKDFENLGQHILNAIKETFREECIGDDVIDKFMNQEIMYSKTSDRSIISKLNNGCSFVHHFEELLDGSSIYQGAMGIKLSNVPFKNGSKGHIFPKDEMHKDLEALAGGDIFSSDKKKRDQMEDLIFDYLRALVHLYGGVSIEKATEIFNMQNDDKISAKDIRRALESRSFDKEIFGYDRDHIVEGSILYADSFNELLRLQQGKPYYIPNKEELLKYKDPFYFEMTDEFKNLKEFIKGSFEIDGKVLDGLCEDIQIRCLSMNFSMGDVLYEFERRKISFNTQDQVRELIPLVMKLANNSRIWVNRGFTAKEIHGGMDDATDINGIDTPDMSASKKVGRNDPCPCGSGKKYKKCCLGD